MVSERRARDRDLKVSITDHGVEVGVVDTEMESTVLDLKYGKQLHLREVAYQDAGYKIIVNRFEEFCFILWKSIYLI